MLFYRVRQPVVVKMRNPNMRRLDPSFIFAGAMLLGGMLACGSSNTKTAPPSAPATALAPAPPAMARSAVIAARRKYRVKVVSFDASQRFGVEEPYSDLVRVHITNGSDITLPVLTLLTKRFDASGRMIGSSRAPAVPVRDLKPGDEAEVDFYPRGHLPGVKKITVEIEALISPNVEKFFEELKGTTGT